MSITNLSNKIKSKTGIDKQSFLLIIVLIFVAIASFGLGRLSLEGETSEEITVEEPKGTLAGDAKTMYNEKVIDGEKRFFASKNGKKYYSLGCGGASRIKPENQIWFKSREDAEKSGFTLSTACK